MILSGRKAGSIKRGGPQCFGSGGEDFWYTEGLAEISGNPEIHSLDGGRFRGKASDDDYRQLGAEALHLPDQCQAVHARHPEVGDQQVVFRCADATEGGARIGRCIDVVLRQCEGFRQQIPDARLVVDHQHAGASMSRCRRRGCRWRAPSSRMGSLTIEPGVDVPFAESPLASDSNGGNLSRFDETVNGPEIDLKVFEDLFGRQKHFVGRQIQSQAGHILARFAGRRRKVLADKYLRRKIGTKATRRSSPSYPLTGSSAIAPGRMQDTALFMNWTDEDLVARSRGGDLDSFNQLILRWERPIYALAYRVIGREEDARDVCQETFLRAFRALPGFKGQAKFSSWLYRIALNLCRDWIRRQRRAPTVQLAEGADPAEVAAEQGPTESIEDLVARRELSAVVEEAMALLPEEQRTAIILKEYHGMTFQEIADLQGCPLSTVKTRLYQGLSVLRRHLEKNGRVPQLVKRV